MPFVAMLMNLKIIIPNEDRQKQMSYDITYRWNLKYDTNELIYKTKKHCPKRNRGAQIEKHRPVPSPFSPVLF